MSKDVIVSSVVICDDIRQEVNGKQILIGVYGSTILVPSMPFSVGLSIWIEYLAGKVGVETIHMKLSYTTGFSALVRAEIQVHELGTMGLAMPTLLVSGAADGELIIELSREGAAWHEIKRKTVRQGQIPAITEISVPAA
jgi:hypothetical protein